MNRYQLSVPRKSFARKTFAWKSVSRKSCAQLLRENQLYFFRKIISICEVFFHAKNDKGEHARATYKRICRGKPLLSPF
ncbi:MAG: hypothetical protein DRR00_05905 [Candidatus Parabeggiatoa sp. nov. 3]|nr:MAG: hypothetical protein DRR00_05905 [Gammaproteobacteria bacterium]